MNNERAAVITAWLDAPMDDFFVYPGPRRHPLCALVLAVWLLVFPYPWVMTRGAMRGGGLLRA